MQDENVVHSMAFLLLLFPSFSPLQELNGGFSFLMIVFPYCVDSVPLHIYFIEFRDESCILQAPRDVLHFKHCHLCY